jgi:outer membrane receptor protein involved in Fe transport
VDPAENFDNSAFVDDDVNTGTYYGGRAGLRWNVTEDWTLDFNGIYQKYELKDGFGDVDLNQQFYSDTATFPTLGEMDQVRFGNEDWEDKWYQLSITSEANLGFANLVVTGAYYDRKSEYNADGTAYLQAFQQFGDTYFPYYNIYDFNGDPQATDFDKRESQTWSFEARLASAESDSRWGWIGGFFYNHREVDELFTSNVRNLWDSATGETPAGYYLNYSYYNLNAGSSARSNNWFTGTYDSDLDQWAVFGEASFDLTENLVITAGGRYYDIENDYTVVQAALVGLNGGAIDCTTVYCYTGSDDKGSGNDDGFVPKVNIAWTVNDQLLYATYSEGFRRGGVNSARPQSIYGAPGQFPPPAGTRNEYGSDTVKNYEAGFKTDWFDNSLRFNLTGYWMKWDDIQVQAEDTITGTFSLGIVNLPEAEIKGFDAWLDWAATESLSLGANIGYNDAEVSETFVLSAPGAPPSPDDTVITDGTQLPLMPDWKINLNGTYTFQRQLLSATPYVLANYVYWGESVNSLGIESSNFTFPVREQPSWQTVDLRAGLDGDTWSASIYVENVFDEYAELFYNNRFAQQRLSVNQPRTYGIGFRKYFGMQNIAK